MNHLFRLAFFCFILTPLCADEYAMKFVMTNTLVQYGSQTIPSLSELANVSLYGTKVDGSAHVDGNLSANDAELHTVVVNGSATLVNCTIMNSISVYGELQMQNCKVYGQVSTYAPLLTLTKTNANSILMLANKGQQNVSLQNGSIISGPITFQSGNGTVTLSSGSYLAGMLTGGRFVRN